MKTYKNRSERGQSIVMVALIFLAFIAVLALVLDGGMVYAARRQAQNAADAGALAGATHMCTYKNQVGVEAAAEGVARDYAVKNNAVNPPEADANLNTSTVIVTATVKVDPFFVQLIGFSNISPRAVAEAQCQPPSGIGIMPVAWSCRKPATGEEPGGEPDPTELGCSMNFGDCKSLTDPNGLKCTYVFMDSVKVKKNAPGYCKKDDWDLDPACVETGDIVCDDPLSPGIDDGTIDCDINGGDDGMGDGIIDLMTGGARSWLDLNGGGGGAAELKKWIEKGFPGIIRPYTWLPNQSGVATSIFRTVEIKVGREVTLPVFDKICSGAPYINTDGQDPHYSLEACTYNTYDPADDRTKEGTQANFHIVAFSQFHITCVQTNKAVAETGITLVKKSCPGHAAAVEAESIDDNDKTIEGYFVEGEFLYGYGSDAGDLVNVGTFTVVLVR